MRDTKNISLTLKRILRYLFLRLLKCFTSAGTAPQHRCAWISKIGGVSPFGHLRITGCYTPTRSFSQLRRVLHPLLMSRHPPYTLEFPLIYQSIVFHDKNVKSTRNYMTLSLFFKKQSIVEYSVVNEHAYKQKTAESGLSNTSKKPLQE